MTNTVVTYQFDPLFRCEDGKVTAMDVCETEDCSMHGTNGCNCPPELMLHGEYDLFDQDGECWNEGCPFPFIPTKEEVLEFMQTRKITGKIE